jgi:hypothetical protein
MKTLSVTFDTVTHTVPLDRHVACDFCRDTREVAHIETDDTGSYHAGSDACPNCTL